MDPRNRSIESWLVRARGLVQGIGYRQACIHHARALGVTGWVRNRMDDSVEAMLQGTPQQLEAMSAWMRDGMSAAIVDELVVEKMPPPFTHFDHFERLPTQ
jgi:acylphosphatase